MVLCIMIGVMTRPGCVYLFGCSLWQGVGEENSKYPLQTLLHTTASQYSSMPPFSGVGCWGKVWVIVRMGYTTVSYSTHELSHHYIRIGLPHLRHEKVRDGPSIPFLRLEASLFQIVRLPNFSKKRRRVHDGYEGV